MKAVRSWSVGLVATALAISVLFVASPSYASILTDFTGNTAPENSTAPGSATDGHINFAVYDQTTGGSLGDIWGTGLAGFDGSFLAGIGSGSLNTDSRYLYVYQMVNDLTRTGPFSSAGVGGSGLTSWGLFSSLGFTEGGSATAAGGPYLSGVSATPGNPSGVSLGGAFSGIAVDAATVAPDFVSASVGLTSFYIFQGLAQGEVSTLFGYTSDLAPAFGNATLVSGGVAAQGSVPIATPEPGTLLLSLCGALGLGLTWWRRKRLQA